MIGHQHLAGAHPEAASFLIPQTAGPFNSQAYTEELQVGLRQRRAPQDFMNAIYSSEGYAKYVPLLNEYEQARAGTVGSYTLTSMIADQFASDVAQLAAANPVWYAADKDPTKFTAAQTAYRDIATAIENGTAPKSPMIDAFKVLDRSYQTYLQYRDFIYTTGSAAGISISQLKNSFNSWVDSLVTEHPNTYTLAYGLFRRLVTEAPS